MNSERQIYNTTYEALEAALALIANPDRWCRGLMTRNVTGTLQRCALGAIIAVGEMHKCEQRAVYKMNELAREHGGYGSLHEMNDDPRVSHECILGLFRRAIREEKGREGVAIAIPAGRDKVAT